MDNLKCLAELEIGESARVRRLLCDDSIRRRLMDMGLIPGTRTECVIKSPWGDPSGYLIRGAVIALRREDAEKIYVS